MTTRPTRTPSHPGAVGSSGKIVAAARRLFLKHGLDGVNMHTVAREAGVARQTVYNQFGSKQEVFHAALEAHWALLGAMASEHLDPTRDPAAVLRDVAADVLTFLKDSDQIEMIRTVVAESRTHPELGPTFHRFGKAPLLERFVAYLGQATSLGSLTCRTPELAARQYLGMIQECLLWPRVMEANEAFTPDEETVITSAVTVFLAAYRPQ